MTERTKTIIERWSALLIGLLIGQLLLYIAPDDGTNYNCVPKVNESTIK